MTHPAVRVFDPPMCCSTGVCGPEPDPALARFAADLQWAAGHGVPVERYSLSREPEVFANTPAVVAAFRRSSIAALPLVLVGDDLLREGGYPNRAELADRLGLTDARADDLAAAPAAAPAAVGG